MDKPERPVLLVVEKEGFPEVAGHLLEGTFDLRYRDLDREGLLREVPHVHGLWIRLRHRIDSEVLEKASNLRFIATPTTGLNHIDLDEAARRSIRIVSLKGEVGFLKDVRATAEHTVALTLATLRKIPAAARHVMDGGWDRTQFQGSEVFGKTVGIVGYGRLGRIVAQYFLALGARVLAADPNCRAIREKDIQLVELDVLLGTADIVSIHVNLDSSSRGFFDARCFAQMKYGAILINTARGELIDEDALIAALRDGRLSAAGLDVLVDEMSEGMASSPVVSYARTVDNVVVTPHIGGYTRESLAKVESFLARKVLHWWNTISREDGHPMKPPPTVVPA